MRYNLPARIDAILRGRRTEGSGRGARTSIVEQVGIVVAFGLLYGAIMGSFGGVTGDRAWQVVYSAAKVPLLLLVTFVLSVPSFFVLNTLLGLRTDFFRALSTLASAQAGLTILLASLAPITLVWYASSSDYQAAILFNGFMFGVASAGAQILVRRGYRPLIERNKRHRILLRVWLVLYAFVGIQLGWILRPFLGAPDKPVQFFRHGDWEIAYVVVARMILNQFSSL